MKVGASVRGERRGGQSPDPSAGKGGVVEVGDGGGVGGGEGGGEASTSFVSEESVDVDLIIRGSAKTLMVDEPQARHGVQGRLEVVGSVGKWIVGVKADEVGVDDVAHKEGVKDVVAEAGGEDQGEGRRSKSREPGDGPQSEGADECGRGLRESMGSEKLKSREETGHEFVLIEGEVFEVGVELGKGEVREEVGVWRDKKGGQVGGSGG